MRSGAILLSTLVCFLVSVTAVASAEDAENSETNVDVNGFFEKGMVGTPKARETDNQPKIPDPNIRIPGAKKTDPRVEEVKRQLRGISQKRLEQARAAERGRKQQNSFFTEEVEDPASAD